MSAYTAVMLWLAEIDDLPNSAKFVLFAALLLLFLGTALIIIGWRDKWLWGSKIKLDLGEILIEQMQNTIGTDRVKYVTIKATNITHKAVKAKARLVKIEGLADNPSYPLSGHLEWKDHPKDTEIDIFFGSPAHFSILRANSNGNTLNHLCSNMPLNIDNLPPGIYVFSVLVVNGDISSNTLRVGVDWNGNWNEIKTFNAKRSHRTR